MRLQLHSAALERWTQSLEDLHAAPVAFSGSAGLRRVLQVPTVDLDQFGVGRVPCGLDFLL